MAKELILDHQRPDRKAHGYWFVYQGDRLLVAPGRGGECIIPRLEGLAGLGLEPVAEIFVGRFRGEYCHAAGVAQGAPAPPGFEWQPQRWALSKLDMETYTTAGAARQLLAWELNNRFCGACGAPMRSRRRERSKICPACSLVRYPRVSPAVIVQVTKGGRILLGRSPRFPGGMYSVLAGFVEPGENLEETVAREVREEAGIEVQNIRYFGSQPWALPDSLMVGFTAEHVSGELRVDHDELEHAGWFRADELPRIPQGGTIARLLIDDFIAKFGGAPGG